MEFPFSLEKIARSEIVAEIKKKKMSKKSVFFYDYQRVFQYFLYFFFFCLGISREGLNIGVKSIRKIETTTATGGLELLDEKYYYSSENEKFCKHSGILYSRF